ncbi:MAG: FKBP-type peptidyl-prolyl cis-trans isomerase N-terminal domain-containing protein [Candidatus Thiodiazotropha sp.]
MHKLLSPLLIFSVVALAMAGEEKTPLSDETDRINYVIGHQIGTDFRKQEVFLDRQSLKSGLEDGHAGSEPSLDPKVMNQLLVNLKKEITSVMEKDAIARLQKRQAEVKHKREAGEEFLQANRSKPGVVTTQSGLQYRIIKEGQGASPKPSERVRIDYTARRLSGQVFDGSEKKGGPTVYPVNRVIRGFSEALQMMKPGSKWEVFLPPEIAYGRRGPLGHETIIIEVELLAILPPEVETAESQMPHDGSADTAKTE